MRENESESQGNPYERLAMLRNLYDNATGDAARETLREEIRTLMEKIVLAENTGEYLPSKPNQNLELGPSKYSPQKPETGDNAGGQSDGGHS